MIHLSQMITHLEVMRIVWNLNEFDVHIVNVVAKIISEELIKIQATRKDSRPKENSKCSRFNPQKA